MGFGRLVRAFRAAGFNWFVEEIHPLEEEERRERATKQASRSFWSSMSSQKDTKKKLARPKPQLPNPEYNGAALEAWRNACGGFGPLVSPVRLLPAAGRMDRSASKKPADAGRTIALFKGVKPEKCQTIKVTVLKAEGLVPLDRLE